MCGGRSSRSTRTSTRSSTPSWRALCALAALALAGACGGGQQTTGTRPGSGGTSGGGATGNGSGGSGNPTGSGGASSSGGANGGGGSSGTGGSGAITDGGSASDGGVCIDDDGHDSTASAVTGTFSGAATGSICTNGAFAFVQSTSAEDGGAPTIALFIDTIPNGDPAARIHFQTPANALDGGLSIYVGLPAASPGTYTQDTTCGNVALFADLPGADPSVCATDGGDCPAGCQMTGGPSNPTCTPYTTEAEYVALASSDCLGDAMTPAGKWTVTLTSLTSEPDAGTGVSGAVIYKVHGTFTATLVDQSADPGAPGVTLTLSF